MFTDATTVTRIAVDDRETIYGINSSGKPVQFGDDSWVSLDLGDFSEQYVMIDVAVALDDTVWYVAREGQYYIHGTNITFDGSRSLSNKSDCSDESSGQFGLEFRGTSLGRHRLGRAGIQQRRSLGVQKWQ
jgi:hypothetical protein